MSVRLRLVNAFEHSVRNLLPMKCQKYSTRWVSPPTKREPKTTSARPSSDRLQQLRVFARVVLEVGVLDDDHVAVGGREPGAQRRTLALVAFVVQHADVGREDRRPQQLTRAVGGTVVHQDDVLVDANFLHTIDQVQQRVDLVVDRNDDRQFHQGVGPSRGRDSISGGADGKCRRRRSRGRSDAGAASARRPPRRHRR